MLAGLAMIPMQASVFDVAEVSLAAAPSTL